MFAFSRPCHRIGLGQYRKHNQRPVRNAGRGLYALAHHREAETATQGENVMTKFGHFDETWWNLVPFYKMVTKFRQFVYFGVPYFITFSVADYNQLTTPPLERTVP